MFIRLRKPYNDIAHKGRAKQRRTCFKMYYGTDLIETGSQRRGTSHL